MSEDIDTMPEPIFPADRLFQRHQDIYTQLRMKIVFMRQSIRPKDMEIDEILTVLQPLLKEDFTKE